MDSLRMDVMINQFVMVSGCSRDQAKQFLQASNWQFEMALSLFFQESTAVGCSGNQNGIHMAPANTPATPPNFPDTLLAFGKMSTGDLISCSPPNNGTVHSDTGGNENSVLHHQIKFNPISAVNSNSPAAPNFPSTNHMPANFSSTNHMTANFSPANHAASSFSPANHTAVGDSTAFVGVGTRVQSGMSKPISVQSRR